MKDASEASVRTKLLEMLAISVGLVGCGASADESSPPPGNVRVPGSGGNAFAAGGTSAAGASGYVNPSAGGIVNPGAGGTVNLGAGGTVGASGGAAGIGGTPTGGASSG